MISKSIPYIDFDRFHEHNEQPPFPGVYLLSGERCRCDGKTPKAHSHFPLEFSVAEFGYSPKSGCHGRIAISLSKHLSSFRHIFTSSSGTEPPFFNSTYQLHGEHTKVLSIYAYTWKKENREGADCLRGRLTGKEIQIQLSNCEILVRIYHSNWNTSNINERYMFSVPR